MLTPEFKEFLEKFLDKPMGEQEKQLLHSIGRNNKVPFDSFNRIFALYLLEEYPEVIENFPFKALEEMQNSAFTEYWNELPQDIKDVSDALRFRAEFNGEQGLIDDVFLNVVLIAKKGKDAVLSDSCKNGGWFGSTLK